MPTRASGIVRKWNLSSYNSNRFHIYSATEQIMRGKTQVYSLTKKTNAACKNTYIVKDEREETAIVALNGTDAGSSVTAKPEQGSAQVRRVAYDE